MIYFAAALALLAAPFASASLGGINRASTVTVVPGRYIVEFDSAAHLQSSALGKRYSSPHEYVYAQLEARNAKFSIKTSFDSSLFVGASISVDSDADLIAVANATGVLNILPVHAINVPDILDKAVGQWAATVAPQGWHWNPTGSSSSATTTASTDVATSCSYSSNGRKQSCTTKTTTVTSMATSSASPSTGFSNLGAVGADKVQAAGNKGKGIKIGIIDGGIDYTRAPLGGCFGNGCKVAGGYDFVGDNFLSGSDTPEPDNDPLDQTYTHGTFVAGVIGANPNEYGLTGVAPEASLYSYRVYGPTGATADDIIMEAMIKAYTDGMDVINLSIGEISGWTINALSVLASRLVAAGVTVPASAGNSGQLGAFYSFAPASGRGVIGTGATNSTILPAHNATLSTGYGPIRYYSFKAFPTATLPLYAYTTDPGVLDDGCNPPSSTPNLGPYLLVVRDGGCSVSQKAQYAYALGNRAIFVVQSEDTEPIYQNFYLTNYATISKADGDYLLSQIAANVNTTVSFSFNPAPAYNSYSGGQLGYFSEIGPTQDMFMSTQVSAPGTNIISVMPAAYGNWSIMDGTSYAVCFASGSAALYLAANKNSSPKTVREALETATTGVILMGGTYKTLAAQGSGLFNIYNALNAGIRVSPSELLLNDTENFDGTQTIAITNTGDSQTTFTLSHVAAGTMITLNPSNNQSYTQTSADNQIPQVSNAATVRFSQSSVTLKTGHSTYVTVAITPPTGLDSTSYPVYSGWIQITGGASTVQVPYLGVAANMKNHPVLDGTDYYLGAPLPTILDSQLDVQAYNVSYSYVDTDYPSVIWRLAGGTRYLSLDLVAFNASLGIIPNYNSRRSFEDLSGRTLNANHELLKRKAIDIRDLKALHHARRGLDDLLALWCQITRNKGLGCSASANANTYSKVPILGNIYELDYVPRNTDNNDGAGNDYYLYGLSPAEFSNGTSIPNGTYQFLIRALKVGGDITKQADYDTWLSGVPFTIAAST